MRCVCGRIPYVLLSEVCVITVRHTMPKQMLAGPRGKKSNQMRILPLFMTPDINLVRQLPAVVSPLDLSHYPSFSHSLLISISLDLCFLYPIYFHVHPSFLDSDISPTLPLCSLSPECIITEIKLLLTWLSFRSLSFSLYWQGTSTGLPHISPWQGVAAWGSMML